MVDVPPDRVVRRRSDDRGRVHLADLVAKNATVELAIINPDVEQNSGDEQ